MPTPIYALYAPGDPVLGFVQGEYLLGKLAGRRLGTTQGVGGFEDECEVIPAHVDQKLPHSLLKVAAQCLREKQ